MKNEPVCTSIEYIEGIPEADLPLLVLGSSNKSFLAWAIRARTDSDYSHLMWMHRPGFFATQDWWYREVPIRHYRDTRLKFWTASDWTPADRLGILTAIKNELARPAWETRYDLLAIMGQLLGISDLEVPWSNICSDWARLLKPSDPDYNLEHPDPGDVNAWLKNHERYICYGRYLPD